jgi:site-specific DNA-adenine methylase
VEDFNNILCNGAGTKVMANNEATTFAALCNELKEKKGVLILKKKRKIESFKVVRDDTNGNCVKIILITYK